MSIRKKITLLFLVSLLMMGAIALWSEATAKKKNETIQIDRYLDEAKNIFTLLGKGNRKRLLKRLRDIGYEVVPKDRVAGAEAVYERPLTFGEISVLKDKDGYYLQLRYLDRELTLYDKNQNHLKKERLVMNLLLGLDIAALILIYLIMMRMFAPLEEISEKMKRVAEGDLDTKIDAKGDDEIARIADSFNEMAERLKKVLESREELIRDVGHELKTPIAKGKFALESVEESKSKRVIERAFDDLDRLTNQIIYIQTLDDDSDERREEFYASTLILESLQRADVKREEDVTVKVLEDFKIEANMEHMVIALKNLVENGLKYATRKPVEIVACDGSVDIFNYGERLQRELEYYTRPFIREDRSRKGFGLGLSIVQKVLKKYGFVLEHEYLDGKNRFSIRFYCILDRDRG